jgi:hypothetical protein
LSILSRINVASALLVIIGIWFMLESLMMLSSPEWYLDTWITMMNEELLPPTVSEISALGQNLLEFMTFTTQMLGLVGSFASLLFIVTSLIPYRKGEKWAWYAMLVIGGMYMFGTVIFTYIGMTSHAPVTMVMVILWIVGLALPAKEILGKPS